MSKAYVQGLVAERDAIISAVRQWGDDAFAEFHPVQPVITSIEVDTPEAGDITINGTNLDSFAPHITRVQVTREGVGDVIRTQAQIEAAPPGEVTPTRIIVDASIIPGGGPQAGDEIRVQADSLVTEPYIVPEPLPEPPVEP